MAHLIFKSDRQLMQQLETFIQEKVFVEGDDGKFDLFYLLFVKDCASRHRYLTRCCLLIELAVSHCRSFVINSPVDLIS